MNQKMSWTANDASEEAVVRAFLSAETDPNDPFFALATDRRTDLDCEGNRALRRLLTTKFEEVVGPWAESNNIPISAFLRLGIQPAHLIGICDHRSADSVNGHDLPQMGN